LINSAVLSGGGEALDATVCAEAATAIVANATSCKLRTRLMGVWYRLSKFLQNT
jgi:hypothetical protein